MLSLAVCRCLFRLMRHWFLSRWTCLQVSESFRQVWKCRLFDVFRCVCIDMEANACGGLFQTMQLCLGLVGCICHNRHVIGVVGIPSASFLFQLENFNIYIYIYSHRLTDCFVLSELFSVARHAGRSTPGSKPVQLYVRFSLRPLGPQANQVG